MKIYTKRGDDGSTGLLYGGRIQKSDLLTEAYGTTDEAVAVLGIARASSGDDAISAEILQLQRELFIVGADLATNPKERKKLEAGSSLVTPDMTDRLEDEIDASVSHHPLPDFFIVPGATARSAALDLARSTVRRAERLVVSLEEDGRLPNAEVLRYLNRLSDYLFVLARREAGETSEPPSRA